MYCEVFNNYFSPQMQDRGGVDGEVACIYAAEMNYVNRSGVS
jgi:hypothetical protein